MFDRSNRLATSDAGYSTQRGLLIKLNTIACKQCIMVNLQYRNEMTLLTVRPKISSASLVFLGFWGSTERSM